VRTIREGLTHVFGGIPGLPTDSAYLLLKPWAIFLIPIAIAGGLALTAPVVAGDGWAIGATALAVWGLLCSRALAKQLRKAESAALREAAERRETERQLAEEKQRLKTIIDSEPECVKIQAADGTILDMNPAGLAIIEARHRDEIIGKSAYGYIAPEWRAKYAEMTERVFRGEAATLEFRLIGRCGGERWMETHAVPLREPDGTTSALLGITRDVTDRRRAEENERQHRIAVAQMQRTLSMGEMATTIAHELNQPLAAIVNYSRGAVRRLHSAPRDVADVIESLNIVSQEADRAAQIIRNIRNLLQKQPTRREKRDINDVVQSVLGLIRPELRRQGIHCDLSLATDLPKLAIVPIEIEQVMHNLARNAIEAMAGISAREKSLSIVSRKGVRGSVEVTLRDTGCGLPSYIPGDVFDPFVTTKPDGLGMGLAITRSIVESHGGRIWIERTSAHGTTIAFALPTTPED
jgi:PAS domain S-box-containing protein